MPTTCQHPAAQTHSDALLMTCPDCGAECSGDKVGDDALCYDQRCPLHAMEGAAMQTTRRSFLTWAQNTGTTVGQLMSNYDGRIGKYGDPTEGGREGLSYEEALAIAREDASLLYVDLTADEEAAQVEIEARASEE